MNTHYIEIGNNDWGVLLCYDYDFRDEDSIWALCRSFGLSKKKTQEAISIIMQPNTGMTISNNELRMSVVFIGDATSAGQFWDSVAHESIHVCQAILDFYGESWDGEVPAYLDGYLFRKIVSTIGVPCR